MVAVISAEEAASLIKSGDAIAFNGMGAIGHPEIFDAAIADRFKKYNEPRDLTLISGPAQSPGIENRGIDKWCYDGQIKKVIAGHWIAMLRINRMVVNNKIEAYNIPQGVMSHLFRAAAGNKPGILTKIGLHTMVDPRIKGGALNDVSTEEWVKLLHIDGEEYLFYKAPKPNVGLIRGTTADLYGNITMEKEPIILDALSIAQAVKANGGKVFVEVQQQVKHQHNARDIVIPSLFVDYIVINPEQQQTMSPGYNPAYSGEYVIPDNELKTKAHEILQSSEDLRDSYDVNIHPYKWIIARRTAAELEPGNSICVGIGIPELVAYSIINKPIYDQVKFTCEAGIIGGIPALGPGFGVYINPQTIYPQSSQFDFYDGGSLDISITGALQVDAKGNVNVSRLKNRIIGVGGFINITQSAKKVLFCFPFTSGGLNICSRDGKIQINQEGVNQKFVEEVEEVSFCGSYALQNAQKVMYITERAVFELTNDGLLLTEIAPGVDLHKDVLDKIPFKVAVSDNLITMDKSIFKLEEVW
jgi:propionate CoA-transferase